MNAIFAILGLLAISAMCAFSHWLGRKAQAAEDFDALVAMIRVEPADETEQESNHYGV